MKKKVRIYKKPCYKCGGNTHMQTGGEFEPHIMYDPKTGKGYPAETMEDHLAMKERGFLHKDEIPKKQFGGNQFSKRLSKELKSSYKPFSSKAPQNQNTDEVVGERKNIFVSSLSNNAFKKYAEEEQQSLQELHQQMKMGGNTSYGMYDQYGGQYPTDEYMPKMEVGGDAPEQPEQPEPTDSYYIKHLLQKYAEKFGTTAVKGFGDYDEDGNHPLVDYANEGETRRAAVIRYMDAMLSDDNKKLLKAAEYLNETDLPDLMSWGWLPGSDEDKLDDMAAIAREEARANIYDQVMGQVDEIDENFERTASLLEKELRKKQTDKTLTTDKLNKVNADLEKLKRIKGVVAKDKRNEVVNYHLKGQVDWDAGNWGQAYADYLDIYNNTFGKRDGDGNWIDKPLQYDLLENISGDLSNSKQSSGSYSKLDKSIPFNKRKFINDNKSDSHTQTDNWLKGLNEKTDKSSGKEDTSEEDFNGEENGAGNEAPKQEESQTPKKPAVQQQPKSVQQQKSQPVQQRSEPNVVKSELQSGPTDEDLELIYQMLEKKKYGGNIKKYAYGSETTFDPPNMITAHNNPYLDKLQQLAGSFDNPFGKIALGAKKAANYVGDMFSNPNKDFGYSTTDGIQMRMNRKGDEKIDLMGTYANRFRQNPVGTVGASLANIAQTAAPIARDISRMREDNRINAYNQKMKMADNVFSPVDNPQERGNWTTNQVYFNPDLMTMQPWFTGQNYQYGGDVVEMTDQEIEEFLRAGGQIEYLD